jgi:exosortase
MNFRTIPADNKIRIFISFATVILLSLTIYNECLSKLIVSILHREGSSHGIFVPFISLFLLWKKREEIKKLEPEFALLPGSIIVMMSLLMLFIARYTTTNTLPALSFFLMTAGVVMAAFGKKIFQGVSFPLFFLMAMIPLPASLYTQITEWMRASSTAGSVLVAQLGGVPLTREGYFIQLPEIKLFVAKSCSGIRYLISYFVFGFAYAFLYKKTAKSRILVIIATIPISFIAGVIRLSVIFLSAYYISPVMAAPHPHILLSWFVFVGILIGLIVADRKLSDS